VSMIQNQKAQQEKDPLPSHEVTLDQAMKLAQAHHRNGNLEIAERTYRDILRTIENHYPTVQLLAAILFQRGNLEEALKFGKIATDVEPENAGCWSNYAAILSTLDRHEDALDAYDQALMLDPEMVETYINKSNTLWLLNRFEEAEETAAQATLFDPDRPEGYLNLGIALASQGKMKAAEEMWEQVIALQPNSGRAYSNWCQALRSQGHLEKAKSKGLKAIELSPEDHESWSNLGCVYKELGEMEEALKAFKKATDIKPDYVPAHMNAARVFMVLDRHEEALIAARYAISFKKDDSDIYIVMSLAYSGIGERNKARHAADMAINIAPDKPYCYLVLADIMIAEDQFDEAEAVLRKALDLKPDEPDALVKLAEVQRSLDMLEEAIASLDKAMEINQITPSLLIEKARTLMHANQVSESLDIINKALDMAPHNPWALLTKSELLLTVNRKDEAFQVLEASREHLEQIPGFYVTLHSFKNFTKDDPDFLKLKELQIKADTFGKEAQSALHYALFEAYEDMEEYDKAFEHLTIAASARKQLGKFNSENMQHAVEVKKTLFPAEMMNQYKNYGFESDSPVFIVGMPRSGTTLTEQIISSHPDIYGAGELYDIGTVIREMGPLTIENAAAMGEAYVNKAKARDISGKALRITDKMPGNYTSLGLIHCMLPKAKIIHCRRNPMDNLFSCYKQNFAVGHHWSYDFDSLADQYAIYRDIMNFWRDTLPENTFIEIDYEETVQNFEKQARLLIDYVGLPWNDSCLKPHKQKRAVLTASKDQVIQPVYQSSVEAWRCYEEQLQPLYKRLKEKGCVE